MGLLRDLTSRVEVGIPLQIKGECIRGATTDARLIEQLVEQDSIHILKADEEGTGEAERLKEEFSIGEEAYVLVLAIEDEYLFAPDDKTRVLGKLITRTQSISLAC